MLLLLFFSITFICIMNGFSLMRLGEEEENIDLVTLGFFLTIGSWAYALGFCAVIMARG